MPISTSPNFTVRVKDLGRLAEAEVELRPMTLFVGENNSGKSYLATLLWAMGRVGTGFFHDLQDPDCKAASEELQALIDKHFASSGQRQSVVGDAGSEVKRIEDTVQRFFCIDFATDTRWAEWAYSMLARKFPAFVCAAIGASHMSPEIEVGSGSGGVVLRLNVAFGGLGESFDREEAGNAYLTLQDGTMSAGITLIDSVLRYSIFGPFAPIETDSAIGALYFPASRTGFIHNLPEMTERQLARSFRGIDLPHPTQMSAPVRQFFRFLVNPGKLKLSENGLAALIEKQLVGGRFSVGPGIAYGYTPAGFQTPLPMTVTSSVVTELLPLWLLVSTGRRPPLLIYEEPEAHLHPRLQRVVAVILARLSRLGTKVLVTTHSETFTQQINNLIKRGGLDPETRAAMVGDSPCEADDYLRPEDVAGYEFRFRDDGRSYTERLGVRLDGIVMPMFNKELLALTDEAIRLDEALAAKQAGSEHG